MLLKGRLCWWVPLRLGDGSREHDEVDWWCLSMPTTFYAEIHFKLKTMNLIVQSAPEISRFIFVGKLIRDNCTIRFSSKPSHSGVWRPALLQDVVSQVGQGYCYVDRSAISPIWTG